MNEEIILTVDLYLINSLGNNIKVAQVGSLLSSLPNMIKSYVERHMRPDDKVGSILDILAPGAIRLMFGYLGMPFVGTLLGLAASVFHINVEEILKSIYEKIKSLLSNAKPVPSTAIDEIVRDSIHENSHPPTQEDAAKFLEKKSFEQTKHDFYIVKLCMIEYELVKEARGYRNDTFLEKFKGLFDNDYNKGYEHTQNVLQKFLSLFFRVAIGSAGLIVAGDVINKFLDRPNALDGSLKDGKEIQISSQPPATQTKFKLKSLYHKENKNNSDEIWTENVQCNKSSIEQMIINFAKDVYEDLDGLDSKIRNTAGFEEVVDKITWYNRTREGAPFVFIPKMFHSKKNIVDWFIDDVAE
jgi:hypothetical protein